MEMTGEQLIAASLEDTWRALNDPEVLQACLPGCESMQRVAEDAYAAVMSIKIGPVSAKFKGKLTLSDLKPPHSYALSFDGQGGLAGFGKGNARVELVPQGNNSTRLLYSANASVGGKLAQVGSRLVDGAAKKLADQFFEAFQQRFG